VSAILSKAYEEKQHELGIDGLALRVTSIEGGGTGGNGTTRSHDIVVGNYGDPSARVVKVASASKIVAGVVMLRLAHLGHIDLAEDSLASVLGWEATIPNASATLDELCAFVGGFSEFNPVMFSKDVTLQEAVEAIKRQDRASFEAPRKTFSYAGAHMHVAAAICEVKTGKTWAELFEEVKQSLGLAGHTQLVFTTVPNALLCSANPMVAGGLVCTVEEMQQVLEVILRKGRLADGSTFIREDLIERFFVNPYHTAGSTSILRDFGYNWRYSFCSWLETEEGEGEGDVISSPGFGGFVPWVDRRNEYLGVLSMEGNASSFPGGIHLASALKPAIEKALLSSRRDQARLS
jgi:CubicO group peptidase (beta-lactamase class C family)